MKNFFCTLLVLSLGLAGCSENPPAQAPDPQPVQTSAEPSPPPTLQTTPTPEESVEPDPDAPEVGSTYTQGKTDYRVVGVGKTPFQYTATGESLELLVGDIPGTIVLVPPAGAVVKVDPTVPELLVDGQPHTPVTDNTYLKKHGKDVRWTLLELIRD